MSNDADFACLKYPVAWGRPKFKIGDFVQNGCRRALVVGISYTHPESIDSQNRRNIGWWFWVADVDHHWHGYQFGETWGVHEDEIHPLEVSQVSQVSQVNQGITRHRAIGPLHSAV